MVTAGQRFGKLTAIEPTQTFRKNVWVFRCDCGKERRYYESQVTKKNGIRSCKICGNRRTKSRSQRTSSLLSVTDKQRERLSFRLARKIKQSERFGPDGNPCWDWQGATSKQGHGRMKVSGKLESPHRIAYLVAHGNIPESKEFHGNVIMHTCDNRICCNPAHLKMGTQKENCVDMAEKGRAGCKGLGKKA